MINYMQEENEQEGKVGMHCFKPYKCDYLEYCLKDLPEKNVFSIGGMRTDKKVELYMYGQ